MRVEQLPAPAAVAVYAALWVVAGMTTGWIASRWPPHRLAHDGPITRIRAWERSGRFYRRRLRIARWKNRLPEAGGFFAGGLSKRTLPGTDPAGLSRYAVETRRAELVHWSQVAFGVTFFAWSSRPVAVAMACFGAAVHLPFIAVQRYGRLRVGRILDRHRVARRPVDGGPAREHDGGVDQGARPEIDEQAEAESIDEETLGEEDLQSDGLRAHDLDLVDSIGDRAHREVPDFDQRRPRSDHTAAQLVAPRDGTDPVPDVFGDEVPADGETSSEESAMHLEDERGRAI